MVDRYWSEWATKLLDEATLLGAIGCLRADGEVCCPECGARVERSDGWGMVFACSCGWRIEDLLADPAGRMG